MRTIHRYAKVYAILLRLNFFQLFAYRAHFISSVVSNTSWALFSIISMILLTGKASQVFGWTGNELLILAGIYNIVVSIFYFLFARNFGEFSNTIHYGRLDGLLMKPIDTQFLMTCTSVSYTQIIRFVLGISFVLYILHQMHIALTILSVIFFMVFLLFSLLMLYSLWMGVMTLTIWFTKLSNLADLLYEGHNVSKYPQEIYKGANVYLFFLLFPLTLIVTVPAKALLQKMFLGDVFWPIIFAVGMFGLARKFWQFALRYYTSASG